jgi:hypothetical protein
MNIGPIRTIDSTAVDTTPTVPPDTGRKLTPELAAKARAIFDKYATEVKPCDHCRAIHNRACPRVKRFKFHPDGRIAEVEFWPDGKWSDDHLIWPEDCEDIEPPPEQLAIE